MLPFPVENLFIPVFVAIGWFLASFILLFILGNRLYDAVNKRVRKKIEEKSYRKLDEALWSELKKHLGKIILLGLFVASLALTNPAGALAAFAVFVIALGAWSTSISLKQKNIEKKELSAFHLSFGFEFIFALVYVAILIRAVLGPSLTLLLSLWERLIPRMMFQFITTFIGNVSHFVSQLSISLFVIVCLFGIGFVALPLACLKGPRKVLFSWGIFWGTLALVLAVQSVLIWAYMLPENWTVKFITAGVAALIVSFVFGYSGWLKK